MARNSLSGGLNLGTGNASSLIKSANSLQKTIANYNDELARITWENSGYTDAALQEYASHLNSRITQLRATGNVADESKALTLQQTLTQATHSNISYHIQQENLNLMLSGDAGTSSGYAQKMSVVQDQFNRAVAIGDTTLAMQLQNQYASLDQSRQSALQTEADAQASLTKANQEAFKAANSALSTGFTDAKNAIHDSVVNLMASIKNPQESTSGKPADVTQKLNDYVKQYGPTYKALTGQDLPQGRNLTIGNIIEASFNAKLAYDVQAAQALGGSDAAASAKFAQFDANGNVTGGDAMKILNNQDYYSVPGLGNVNFKDARNISAVPNRIREITKMDGTVEYKYNAVSDIRMINGEPMLVSNGEDKAASIDKQHGGLLGTTGTLANKLGLQSSQKIQQQLVKAGFGDVKYNSSTNTFTVKLTAQSDHWLQAHGYQADLSSGNGQSGSGNELQLLLDNNTGTLKAITSGGRLVNFAIDTNGRMGAFQTLPNGQIQHLSGQYGFNQRINTLIGNASIQQLRYHLAQQALQAQQAKANAGAHALAGGQQLPGSFNALHPGAGGGQPSHYIGPQANMAQRAGGGFNFTQNGQSISAARYAQLTNTPFRTLLQTMANKGDAGARAALGFVGNDYGYDPGHIGNNASLYNSLTWGVAPAARTGGGGAPSQGVKGPNSPVNVGGLRLK